MRQRLIRLGLGGVLGYLLILGGMHAYVFGPAFAHRVWYVFTEGESRTPAQAASQHLRDLAQQTPNAAKRMLPQTSFRIPPLKLLTLKIFKSMEWRLRSADPDIQRSAFEDIAQMTDASKAQLAKQIAESMRPIPSLEFNRDMAILERLGPSAESALPIILQRYSDFAADLQPRLWPWFVSLKGSAKAALPVLWTELEQLKTKKITGFYLTCGTPPLPEYRSVELLRAAQAIAVIRMIDPNQKEALVAALQSLKTRRKAELAFFCNRELRKL